MAVYTDVADGDLRAFLAEYDLGVLLSFKGIAEGVENSNFLLRTDAGNFILTLYEKRVAAGDLPFFVGLMEYLSARGINCPLPIRGKDGAVLRELAGRPAAIVSFLDGIWVRQPQAAHCAAVGSALASMHGAGSGFGLRRQNALSIQGWDTLVDMTVSRADVVEPGLGKLMTCELAALRSQWPITLPSGVIHADLFPDNVFFLDGRLSGLIDFYFACEDFLAYDLAICLNAWCFSPDHIYEPEKGRALIGAYESVRSLNAAERAALPLLARGAALRFLLTRLYDWLTVPEGALVTPKDPLEYLHKLRFHQQVATADGYGINDG